MNKAVNLLLINTIRLDGNTQTRMAINEAVVAEYAEAIGSGTTMPQVVVFYDGTDFWLADGFHRWHAHRAAGLQDIDAEIHAGTQRDARLFATGANRDHGIRPTNADKRKIVGMLLEDAEWSQWSDSAIATQAGVGRQYVNELRRAQAAQPVVDDRLDAVEPTTRKYERGGKEVVIDVSKSAKPKGASKTTQASAQAAQAPALAAAPDPGDLDADARAAVEADMSANMPRQTEMLEQAEAEREAAEQRAADLEKALQADDKGAELANLIRRLEHASRRQNELMEDAASSQRRANFYEKQLARCGKAVGVRDLGKVAQAVVDMARTMQTA